MDKHWLPRGVFSLILLALVALTSALPVLTAAAPAEARTPQLMDGKKTLHQRVLTRPGATVVTAPGEAAGTAVPAFSQYYVYDRKAASGSDWLEVGASATGKIDGWIAAASTLPWKQQMALVFTNPAGREPTLLLAGRDDVMSVIKAPDPAAAIAPLRASVAAGTPDPRVLSTEPETYVDIEKEFYLLPILQAQEEETAKGFRVRVLEVASLSKTDDRPPGAPAPPSATEAIRAFSAAIVFVIDSTISMGPYIDRTREAVARVHEAIEKAELGRQVRFGLVAFRSSTDAVSGLEYLTQVYADPGTVKDGNDFLARVKAVKPATVSSARFDEDSYAGVMAAVEGIDWDPFGSRHIVLITDAGAIDGSDSLSSTGFNAQQVRLELARKGIALWALHLKTPAGKRNHARAKRQYAELAQWGDAAPLYFDVESGSVETFGQRVDRLAGMLINQVKAARGGELVAGSARSAARDAPPAAPAAAKPPAADDEARLAEAAALVGRAMQLAYLGRVMGTEAPSVFQAWLSDRDYAHPDKATTEVRVLLSKNQLSDLEQTVSGIIDAGEKSQATSTADFFDLIRSAAAHMSRDPEALKNPDASRLGDLGLLGEYLDDLPYKSDVASLDRDDWVAWSTSQQEELLDRLRGKLRHYQNYARDADRWIALAPGAAESDKVYPVPLEGLP